MGEVIQLQGDHRIKIRDFLVDSESGLGLDEKNIKVRVSPCESTPFTKQYANHFPRSTASKPGMSLAPQLSGPAS
jgi:hypothetical protein